MNKKKPKVYIPTYKIIILCGSIITACMVLLLITNLVSIRKSKLADQQSISQRFEPETKPQVELTPPVNNSSSNNKSSISIDEVRGKDKTEETKKISKTDSNTNSAAKTQKKPQEPTVTTNTNNKKATVTVTTTTESTTAPKVTTVTPPPKVTAPAEKQTPVAVETKPVATTVIPEKEQAPKKSNFGFPQAVNNAQLVFVFDDGGQNLNHLDNFLKLPFPITIAVLPQLAHSKEAADKIRKSGHELMLHQPMQALNSKVNPGPGAITPEMSEDEIISTLFKNITEIGPIAGMNNHEGSAITADADKMSVVMKIAAENGVYFLDSRTNVETKVPFVADALGYSYYERNVFLDNSKNRNDILKEINKGITLANKNGVVIMIGHIWSADVLPGILNEIYPELKQKGYTFSTVSESKAKKY